MTSAAVLFDLDGTLIDSAPSILESYRLAFEACGLAPVVALDAALIGPPLRPTLARLLGGTVDSVEAATLDRLAAAFRVAYDGAGYRATVAYPGLHAVLDALAAAGRRLFIVTNKRLVPTRLILDHFGIGARFEAVYALDAFAPPVADKTAALAVVLVRHGLDPAGCVYIGDTPEDAAAAAAHALPFVAAGWGYGDPGRLAEVPARARVETLTALPEVLLAPDF